MVVFISHLSLYQRLSFSLSFSPSKHIPFIPFDQVYSQTVEMQWKWNWNCTHIRKLGMDVWMDGLQQYLYSWNCFFTIDACNLILSLFALSEQTYHLKLKLCVLNVCSNFFFLFLSWNWSKDWNTFKVTWDKSAEILKWFRSFLYFCIFYCEKIKFNFWI